jgi:hypothetical protein
MQKGKAKELGVDIGQEQQTFTFFTTSRRLWDSFGVVSNNYRGI